MLELKGEVGVLETYVAVGPVSASPSPIMTGTMRSFLSMTAPKATLRAYPSSPPSWILPGTCALMWLGNPPGVEKPVIRLVRPFLSNEYCSG